MFNSYPEQITAVRIKKGSFVYYRTMQGKLANRLNLDLANFTLVELEIILNDLLNEMDLNFDFDVYKGDNHIRVTKNNHKEELLLIGDRALIIGEEPVAD